jgi:hypothetical protein
MMDEWGDVERALEVQMLIEIDLENQAAYERELAADGIYIPDDTAVLRTDQGNVVIGYDRGLDRLYVMRISDGLRVYGRTLWMRTHPGFMAGFDWVLWFFVRQLVDVGFKSFEAAVVLVCESSRPIARDVHIRRALDRHSASDAAEAVIRHRLYDMVYVDIDDHGWPNDLERRARYWIGLSSRYGSCPVRF